MDKQLRVIQIIDEAINCFLDAINTVSENGPFRKRRMDERPFSILEPANKEYYEYAYFAKSLESYTRDLLVNPTLQKLFELYNVNCSWPEYTNQGILVRSSNTAYEDRFPFEFIIHKKGQKIGFRYTGLADNEVPDLIKHYKLSEIVHIIWDNSKKPRGFNSTYLRRELFSDVFKEYLPEVDYELYLSKLKNAVTDANADIGFQTIPRLSLRYLSNFKWELEKELKEMHFESMQFLSISGSSIDYDNGNQLSQVDHEKCIEMFKGRKLYKALVGTEGFAKCFLTAEYAYHIFKQGYSFDYTMVVCGYLKAIEQLLYKIICINLQYPSTNQLWIKANNKVSKTKKIDPSSIWFKEWNGKKIKHIEFKSEFVRYFDTTLGSLINFVMDNSKGWVLSEDGRNAAYYFLNTFKQSCRNEHFHKDNIELFEMVEAIRNNALLCAYVLLGGYMTGAPDEALDGHLGIIDNTYDQLYKRIQELPKSIKKFIIVFDEGRKIKAYRDFHQERTLYDENGSVSISSIRFIQVNEFNESEYIKAMEGEYTDREFYLDRYNMPHSISYINGFEEIVLL